MSNSTEGTRFRLKAEEQGLQGRGAATGPGMVFRTSCKKAFLDPTLRPLLGSSSAPYTHLSLHLPQSIEIFCFQWS